MRRKYNIRAMVHTILIEDKMARNSDQYLYMEVCRRVCPEVLRQTYRETLFNHMMPSYESVSRSRRWVQEHYPVTTASERVQAGRMMEEEEYKEVFVNGR